MDAKASAESPDLLSLDADLDSYRPETRRTLLWGGLALALIVAAALVGPWLAISAKQDEFARETRSRAAILAGGRAEVIATWLGGVLRLADRVVQADLFRLFAAELAPAPGGDGLPPHLVVQVPYMNQLLTEFAQNAGFAAAQLVGRDGRAYVGSALAGPLTSEQRTLALRALVAGRMVAGPVRLTAGGLLAFDIYLPLSPPQAPPNAEPVGVIALRVPLSEKAAEFLAPPPLALPHEVVRLLQRADAGWQEIAPAQAPPLQPREIAPLLDAEGGLPFAQRATLGGTRAVYSLAAPVRELGWLVVLESDAATARAGVRAYAATMIGLAALVVIGVAAAFGAFWWRLVGEHNRALAHQFQSLAARIDAQRRLLDSVNNTIVDHIGLKRRDGSYAYVNPAFATAVGRPAEQIVGQDDAAIFGHGTAQLLKRSDDQALAGTAVTTEEKIYLQSRPHHLQISKVPLPGADGAVSGIVSVTRDITELVEQRERRERAVRQTVAALVRAVELRDPYLAGHSRRVAGLAAAVARQLGADAAEIDTVEIAANLSQIGKLAIRRDLLNKPERLTPEEIKEMQQHVEHAARVLRDIDFGLPVLETIYQMHERLDGTGYPRGLEGEQIRMTARILACCDVLCARIEPRAYRGTIPPAEALKVLETHPDRYDARVVRALAEVVGSHAGEKLLAGAAD
jgi:PAS domain S-box-containing protein